MKKILRIPLLLVALLLSSIAHSAGFEVDGISYNVIPFTDKTVEVAYLPRDTTGSIVIPETVIYNDITYSVTEFRVVAFWNCAGLTSLTIPNSLTFISGNMFYGCTGLTSIKAKSDNRIFDSRNNCNAIIETATNELVVGCKNTSIPNSVTSIGGGAFSDCTGLTSVTIPNSVTYIGGEAFSGCTGLTSVTIPNSVTNIGGGAFYGCTGLTSVTIPNSVTSIGDYAFSGCTGLTTVNFNANNITYMNYVFEMCTALTTLNIGDNVINIPDRAFEGCTSLTSVSIPNSVTKIGEHAFEGCTSLTSITIPNSVTYINSLAFSECTGLTEVTIPNSVTTIDFFAFRGCTGLTTVNFNATNCTAAYYPFEDTSITTLNIGDNVTNIPNSAFYGCSSLTSVTIPNSVTKIGPETFYGCTGLTSIISLNPEPPLVSSIFRFLYDNTILYVPKGCVVNYSTAYAWADFSNIIELGENGEMPDIEVALSDGEATISFPKEENIVECKMSVWTTIPGSEVIKESVWVDNASRSSSSQISMNVDGLDVGNYIYRISVKYESGEIEEKYAGKFSINVSGIDDIESSEATEIARYDIHGRRLAKPTKGINIIIYSDGSTKKEFVK